MKPRWSILIGLAVVGLICALLASRANSQAREAVEVTRRALRQQGFKTDLADFDFSTSVELRAREAALTNADLAGAARSGIDRERRSALLQGRPELMTKVGADAALVLWQEERLESRFEDDLWPTLREVFGENQTILDAACEAALSGSIHFHLIASHGLGMLLPHLAALKHLTHILGSRAVLELHDGHREPAWTNLLVATRLTISYDPEPTEVSHLTRFDCAAIAHHATWQVLQAGGWTDARLAQVQQEWEAVDFFKGLQETAAFARASTVATCQLERQQPLGRPSVISKDLLSSPRIAWSQVADYWRARRYRHHGTYEDESALLLHYRDRELELRNAVSCPTWSEMRTLPGVTNLVPFRSKHYSATTGMLAVRQVTLWIMMPGQGLLGRAADAESRRRLLITAVALERYRGRYGSYPKSLGELVPELLKSPPVDFIDGEPLRYRSTDHGHFVLYSVGLDCVDNGGAMPPPRLPRWPGENSVPFGIPFGTDLVWPRPGSADEIAAEKEAEARAREEAAERALSARAAEQREEESLRRATVQRLLSMKPARRAREPVFQGRLLSDLLRNTNEVGAARLTLDELLKLRQVLTGEEPDVATFELPIRYDLVTNLGELQLLVDTGPEEEAPDERGELQECARATNGNCLLVWNTLYDPPGQHALQAQLFYTDGEDSEEIEVKGPVVPFFSSNLCQFDPFLSELGPRRATLYASLAESNATFTIDLRSPAGDPVKTFRGTTSNGVIKVRWDLIDDRGRTCTNESFDSVFHVTLTDSGRSQTTKGR